MPSVPRIAAAVTAATVAAVLAFPPSRRQVTRAVGAALDEAALRLEHQWAAHVILLTTEGRQTALPRTTVLLGLEHDGALYAVPWTGGAGWVANCEAHPDVVVDDRRRVRRAKAAVVRGEAAVAIREAYLQRHIPAWLRPTLERVAGNAELPVVRLSPA